MKFDLNAPASEGFKNIEIEEASDKKPAEVSQTKKAEEGTDTSGSEPVVEEARVPYSRIEKATRLREAAEARAVEAEERYQELLSRRDTKTEEVDTADPLYNEIVTLYGAERAPQIYKIEQQRIERMEERAYEKALEATREFKTVEAREETANLETIDERFENLSEALGRELTAPEQDSLLDIIDEYTPKDRDGNYLGGDTISFEKAYEIYELQQAQSASANKRSRSNATALTGSKSSGEPTLEQQKQNDADWQPNRGFGKWRDRFTNN